MERDIKYRSDRSRNLSQVFGRPNTMAFIVINGSLTFGVSVVVRSRGGTLDYDAR